MKLVTTGYKTFEGTTRTLFIVVSGQNTASQNTRGRKARGRKARGRKAIGHQTTVKLPDGQNTRGLGNQVMYHLRND